MDLNSDLSIGTYTTEPGLADFVVLIECPITSFGLMSYLSFFESISFLHCHCQNVMSYDISHSPLKVFSISVHPLLSDY